MTRPCTDHTCNYHCELPECVRAQRDEMRERLARQRAVLWRRKDSPTVLVDRRPLQEDLWEPLGLIV